MKNTIILFWGIFLMNVSSYKTKDYEKITGSIYIKLVDIGCLYGADKKQINSIKKEIENYKKALKKIPLRNYYMTITVFFLRIT